MRVLGGKRGEVAKRREVLGFSPLSSKPPLHPDMKKTHSIPSNPTLPNQLWRYRTQMGYSQTELARLLGLKTPARLCDYEQGKRLPNVAIALKLSILLRTPIPQL